MELNIWVELGNYADLNMCRIEHYIYAELNREKDEEMCYCTQAAQLDKKR